MKGKRKVFLLIIAYICLSAMANIEYSYDSLGRISSVLYPNGMKITYNYDKNGNIESCIKEDSSTTESAGQSGDTTGEEETTKTEATTEKEKPTKIETTTEKEKDNSQTEDEKKQDNNAVTDSKYEAIKNYNLFKKKRPIIRFLKIKKKKKKNYLKLTVRRVNKNGLYQEKGYQIKYATNSKFKKSKTMEITEVKKSLTSTEWKVKKNKTYYVKVRAYIETPEKKKIYTKYSKVEKIKVE